ncbi:hypothetical protein QTP88_025372 [Uroleucon formosanum]
MACLVLVERCSAVSEWRGGICSSWWGLVGTVGGDDGFTDRASPSTPLPPADGRSPLRRQHGPSRPSTPLHALTHAHTYVTKRDEELRMRTTEKCNTESPAVRRVVTHRLHTHAQNRRLRSRVLLLLRYVFTSLGSLVDEIIFKQRQQQQLRR